MDEHRQFVWASGDVLKDLAADDTLWGYYLDTEVYLEAPGLRGTVRPLPAGPGGVDPPLGPLHVISVTQPGSHPVNENNRARMQVLDRELHAAGTASIRAVGCSISADHQEESRAVSGLDDVAARELGLRFGQVAVFAWRGPRWSLLACAVDRQTHRAWRWDEKRSAARR